jgi:acyl carrier protein
MVPSAFVELDELPLTSNGKLDRQALPVPDRQPAAHGYLAPRTEAEEALANIWAEVLGLERVGVHDNFFELGGHSLLAIQIISRLRQALGCDIPVRLLFDHPTVAALDAALEATLGADMDELLDRIETMPDAEVEALLQAGDMS